jgi:hypothetical protein
MEFVLNEDQASLAAAIDRIATGFSSKPTNSHDFVLLGSELERELDAGAFFEIARMPGLGPLSAALTVERLARLPFAIECALSMLVLPHIPGDWERPCALVQSGAPVRFAQTAKTLILVDDDEVRIARPSNAMFEPIHSILAYPMGRPRQSIHGAPLSCHESDTIRKWLRVALASEAAGLMHGAIASTVEHIGTRQQFGRQLGTFQALRHRIAECEVLAGGVRLLAAKAAWSADPSDAALAAFHAQECASRITYDTHQMLGAMGMTLEHPLHLWTYRLKALISDLGGRSAQASAVATPGFSDSNLA